MEKKEYKYRPDKCPLSHNNTNKEIGYTCGGCGTYCPPVKSYT